MYEILNFLETYEYVIYFVFGITALIYLYRFVMAWSGIRASVFGLELVNAQKNLNRSAMALFVILFFVAVVFVLITFVSPVITPELAVPELDETISSLATQQSDSNGNDPISTQIPSGIPTITIDEENCIEGVLEITSPVPGEIIRKPIEIIGTVNIPNLGFFTIDINNGTELQGLWGQIGVKEFIVTDDVLLASFDPTSKSLNPGEYVLQLVVHDNENNQLPPCRVPITIAIPEE